MNKGIQKENAITLIALVVTIVVLLILAGVSISMLTGENGIITKTQEAKVQQSHGTVKESIVMAYNEYKTEVAVNGSTKTFVEFLEDEKEYIDTNGVVKIAKLNGEKLPLGNGTGTSDIYKIEEVEGYYELNYYDKAETVVRLEKISISTTGSVKFTLEPGLYETGTETLIKDWETLKTDGDIVVTGNTLTSMSSALAGDLVISEEVECLSSYANVTCGNPWNSQVMYLTGLYIPGTVVNVPENAFAGGVNLKKVVLSDGIESIGDYAFLKCTELTSIEIPNSVTSIGDDAFYGCTGLTSITIPNSVTSIGGSAFGYCTGLTSIELPNNMTYLGSWVFSGCTGLTRVKIPNGLSSIEQDTFYGCTGLTSIKVPNGVMSIDNGAFYGCIRLTNIEIPTSVTSIGESAFGSCTGLTSINYKGSEEQWDAITIKSNNSTLTKDIIKFN